MISVSFFGPEVDLFMRKFGGLGKRVDPYETLPLCSESKGRGSKKSSKYDKEMVENAPRKSVRRNSAKTIIFNDFCPPGTSVLGDFGEQKRSGKVRRKKGESQLIGNQRDLNRIVMKNYVYCCPYY